MKSVSVSVKGKDENRHAMRRRKAAATAAAVAQVQLTAHAIVSEARGHLDNASRLPVSRTGELASSLHVVRSAEGLLANVRTLLDYGAYLEFGTRKMPAYPWLGPAARKHLAGFKARIRLAIRHSLQGHSR
ncbi:MAG: hypothetical protein R8J41_14250 [Alphaproteobacteria bacterium]|nr:hypothetical protein [Alphaproteobacteria bacterium]